MSLFYFSFDLFDQDFNNVLAPVMPLVVAQKPLAANLFEPVAFDSAVIVFAFYRCHYFLKKLSI